MASKFVYASSCFKLEDKTQIAFPMHCTCSLAKSHQTKARKCTDTTGTTRDINVLIKRGKNPSTMRIDFKLIDAQLDGTTVFDWIGAYTGIVGKNVEVVHCYREYGRFIVSSVSITLVTDGTLGVPEVSISMNLTESKVFVPSEGGTTYNVRQV